MQNLTIDNIELISEDEIYRIAHEEMDKGDTSHGAAVKAIEEARGDKELLKKLFIKFQYEEFFKREADAREEAENKERKLASQQWQRQMEIDRKEIELAERRRKLKRLRQLEEEQRERKRQEIQRWSIGITTIMVAGGLACYFGYKNQPSVAAVPGQHQPNIVIPANANLTEKLAEYRKAAEQGDVKAQLHLAMAYKNGKEIGKDEAQAAQWFRKAAEKGSALAQDMLAYLYANGKGVGKDKVQATFWYRKAAEQGYLNSQFNLAIAYKNGIGVAKDEAQAVKWFEKAANQGDPEAQAVLGKIYENGMFGVKKNTMQAAVWYRKSATQGNQEALDALINLKACS